MARVLSAVIRAWVDRALLHQTGRSWYLSLLAALSIIAGSPPAIAEVPPAGHEAMAFLGVRVLKTVGAGTVAWTPHLPDGCVRCQLVLNRATSTQNSKEILFHLSIPKSLTSIGPIVVQIDSRIVRGVLASYTDSDLPQRGFARPELRTNGAVSVAFTRRRDGITFDVPGALFGHDLPPDDLGDVSEHYTYLETPGVYVRVGHADAARRRGPYASGPWPDVEARAALNLEFAAREAIVALHLDKTLGDDGVTTVMLMNFDTNYPTLGPDEAHDDWPPHWHMHLYWNDGPKVRRVGHFFISSDGLLTQDQVSELEPGSPAAWTKRWYARGEADQTVGRDGRLLYAQTITTAGFFMLSAPSGTCRFTPVRGGFDSGVILSCDTGRPDAKILAIDDTAAGSMRLFIDDRMIGKYDYDTDTGALIVDHVPDHHQSRYLFQIK